MKRSKQLLSFGAILLLLVSLLTSLIPPVTVHADPGPPGQAKWAPPIAITTCQGLRDITNNPDATYALSNDLSCSGFISIGKDDEGNVIQGFRGRLYGQGHTISNLDVPLFDEIPSGIITNLNISGNLTGIEQYSYAGFLAVSMSGGIISDVHVNGVAELNQNGASVGGFAGSLTSTLVQRSSVDIIVESLAAQTQFAGMSVSMTSVQVKDSYVNLNVDASAGGVEHAGGLAVSGSDTKVINSYTTGSITSPGNVHEGGGLFWYGYGTQITNSFSTLQNGGLCNGTNGCSGLVTNTDPDNDLSTAYFDQTVLATNLCNGDGSITNCQRVNTDGSQPNYFKNNTVNGPLSNWDFSNVWATSVGLPTLRSFNDPSPAPDPVEQLTANIGSATSVDLSWTLPANLGSSPILAQEIYYQKVGDTEWQQDYDTVINSYFSPSDNFTGTSFSVDSLEPATSYNFEVVLYNQDGYVSTATVTGVTGTPGFHVINSCQELQDISNNLLDSYELGRNIDCSGSTSMNGGLGFAPIGCEPSEGSYESFLGNFAGNNYTISNIYVDGGSLCYDKAIFGSTNDALIQDFTVTNPTINGSENNNYTNAVITPRDRGSTFNNIHVSGGDFTGNDRTIGAGLIGRNSGSLTTTVNQVSFVGDISGDTSKVGSFGGIIGDQNAPLILTNSYVQVNLSDVSDESFGAYVGGLVGFSSDTLHITNSYASLNLDFSASTLADGGDWVVGGLISGAYYNQPSITHSFAVTHTQAYSGDRMGFGGLLGLIQTDDPDVAATPLDLTGNYFDADTIETNQCAGSFIGDEYDFPQAATCTGISGQPNYFLNNQTNPPLNSWDFDNIWATTSTLPVFSRKALITITPIPASRLIPRTTPTTPVKETIAAKPISPAARIAQLEEKRAQAAATSEPTGPKGIIEQLKQLLSHVPTSVLVSFPYLLFGLLLLAALALLLEVFRQAKRLKELNLLLAKQRSVAEKRDTFWHLAANYLRAPITLLMGGADLLALGEVNTSESHQLATLSQQLQAKVAGIMQQIEHSSSLQGIKAPPAEKQRRVLTSVGFWLPVLVVAILIILTNYVAQSWRGLNLSTINLATQVLFFVLASIALYWVLGALGVVSGRRRSAEKLLAQQEQALDAARLHLMSQTAIDLDADVNHLQSLLSKLSTRSQAKPIMQEGASRLRHLVDSFSLLISAQNHKLTGLSPIGAQTSLERVLKAVVADLEPQLTAKGVTLDLPAARNLRVPGNSDLNNQVLSSVLSNAVAFSPSGSTIRLDIEQTEAGTSLTVADHGPGITPTQQAHLFEPFTKADGLTGLQLDHDGLGINLYLDRQIMDYLGGSITVTSTSGQGATVELHWPQVAPKTVHPGAVVHPA